ncbi:MAG TPA: hypothetical protein VER08_09840 [Pyrinomonadaceae bacterium]|nr:hypothetical protein [Pyrinomonadaceae bacterium]
MPPEIRPADADAPTPTPQTPDVTRLEDALGARAAELDKELARRWFRQSDPERLQPLGVIRGLLGEVRRVRVLGRPAADEGGRVSDNYHFIQLLSREVASLGVRAAWEYADELQRLLLQTGGRHYVHARLAKEANRLSKEHPTWDSWDDHFDAERLKRLLKRYDEGGVAEESAEHRQAVELLSLLYAERGGAGRHRIARSNLRTRYLNRLAVGLALLLALLFQFVYLAGEQGGSLSLAKLSLVFKGQLNFGQPDLKQAFLAALAGALGSLLSALYKLRDEVVRIDAMRTFRSMMLAQPFLGAVAGLFLFFVLKSRILGIQLVAADGVPSWAAFAVFGFVAGFSEPFLLNVVGRVVSAADKSGKASKQEEEDKAKAQRPKVGAKKDEDDDDEPAAGQANANRPDAPAAVANGAGHAAAKKAGKADAAGKANPQPTKTPTPAAKMGPHGGQAHPAPTKDKNGKK